MITKILWYWYLLFSSGEYAPPDESEVQGTSRKEKLGIFQVIERLEKITDTLLSK